MAVATDRSQLPVHLNQDSTVEYSELHQDPLGEFLPEESPAGGSSRLLRLEPVMWVDADEAIAMPVYTAPAPKGRWFIGGLMLCVGLVAGFAVAGALVWQLYGNGTRLLPISNGAEPAVDRADVPATRSLPPLTPPVDAGTASEPPLAGDRAATAVPAPAPAAAARPSAQAAAPVAPVDVVAPGLYVQSRPAGAAVYLDGQLISTAPFQLTDIAPGMHTVTVIQPGYREWSASVNIRPGAGTRISASLEPE